jgi:sortase B
MSVAAKVGIVLIRAIHGFVNIFVLVVVLLLLTFGCYAMWDSGQIHVAASSGRYEKYRPAAEDDGASFEYLQSINPDVFAWLTVYGTNIDYPMVQGKDNIRYVNISAEGRYSLSGAIFFDYRSNPHLKDFNSIVYGHHMEGRTMFGEIAMFADKAYFDGRRYGMLFFDEQKHGLEFFAFVYADANDNRIFKANVSGPQEQQAYLDLLMETAINIREDVPVSIDDRIVLLTTCSPNSTSGRDILIGKIIDDVPEDPFVTEQTDSPAIIPMIDDLPNLWEQTATWVKVTIASLLFLLVLPVIVRVCKTKRKGSKRKHSRTSRMNRKTGMMGR